MPGEPASGLSESRGICLIPQNHRIPRCIRHRRGGVNVRKNPFDYTAVRNQISRTRLVEQYTVGLNKESMLLVCIHSLFGMHSVRNNRNRPSFFIIFHQKGAALRQNRHRVKISHRKRTGNLAIWLQIRTCGAVVNTDAKGGGGAVRRG